MDGAQRLQTRGLDGYGQSSYRCHPPMQCTVNTLISFSTKRFRHFLTSGPLAPTCMHEQLLAGAFHPEQHLITLYWIKKFSCKNRRDAMMSNGLLGCKWLVTQPFQINHSTINWSSWLTRDLGQHVFRNYWDGGPAKRSQLISRSSPVVLVLIHLTSA